MRTLLPFLILAMFLLAGCADLMEELPEDCDTLDAGLFGGRDECWTDKAVAAKEVEICEYIEGSYRSACIGKVASVKQTLELCVRPDIDKGWCARIYLQDNLDKEINTCDAMTSVIFKDECFSHLATLSGEVDTCSYTSDPSVCIGLVAREAKSDLLCDDAPQKETCVRVFAQK